MASESLWAGQMENIEMRGDKRTEVNGRLGFTRSENVGVTTK
jgi:hypothetical protein